MSKPISIKKFARAAIKTWNLMFSDGRETSFGVFYISLQIVYKNNGIADLCEIPFKDHLVAVGKELRKVPFFRRAKKYRRMRESFDFSRDCESGVLVEFQVHLDQLRSIRLSAELLSAHLNRE